MGIMSHGPIWENNDGVIIKILVRPRSKERAVISELTDEYLAINIRAPAREGKANIELLKQLAKLLHVSTANIEIISGHKSREKTIKVIGIQKEQVVKLVTNDK
ncbi:MAG: YggU family protein [Candidatus Thorarchaeota archaeon]|nr:YggU family protein [Candidatus Thorarchaeota archaeon]